MQQITLWIGQTCWRWPSTSTFCGDECTYKMQWYELQTVYWTDSTDSRTI